MDFDTKIYNIGSTTIDTPYVLLFDSGNWCVGSVERGLFFAAARFNDPITAAEYLIFLIKQSELGMIFPDWTDYAEHFGAAGTIGPSY